MLILSSSFLSIWLTFVTIAFLIHRLLSPLRKLPGPKLSLFTSAVLKWHELRGYRTRYIHALHRKYGPVVRIAPDEVALASLAAVKDVYCSGGSGYDKTEFYDLFRVYGRRLVVHWTMFTMLDKDDHAKRRRIIADRYANSNIMRSVSLSGVEERSRRFVQRIELAKGDSVDIYMCLHSYACDCVTHHLFHPYGTNCLQKTADEEMMFQVASDDSLQNRLILHYSPLLHKAIAKVLYTIARPRETPLADAYILERSRRRDPATFTLLNRLRDKSSEVEEMDMAAECLDHMAAGIDTTGDALCFLMWELSQPRSAAYLKKLQRELRVETDVSFDKLPYLDAVVSEGLRCFPAIPMSLPRRVPKEGRVIDGYFLPGGTVASCQAYSVHRVNEEVFPEPDLFNPDRWLEEAGEADRKRLLFAFSNGGRGCVGKHLALAEMKILLRDIYSRFNTVPDEAMRQEDMEMSDQLISSRPRGQKCLLRFVPINNPE